MSAKNPNTVTITNQTGQTISALALGHSAGVSFAPPVGSDPVVSGNDVPSGAPPLSGTAFVADGLADFWLMGVTLEGSSDSWILIASGIPVPYKKCDTPDNGSTTFTLQPPSGGSIPVQIDTFNSDGSSDGSCSASMITSSSFSSEWEEVLEIIIEWLGDGGEDARAPTATSATMPMGTAPMGTASMRITPELVTSLSPCNHWKNPDVLRKVLGKTGKPLAEVLQLDSATSWEKLWLALRPEVLGARPLERFVDSLVGAPPFSDDGTDSPMRRRTFTGAMAMVTTMIDKRVLELRAHPSQIPAVSEGILRGVVDDLARFIAS